MRQASSLASRSWGTSAIGSGGRPWRAKRNKVVHAELAKRARSILLQTWEETEASASEALDGRERNRNKNKQEMMDGSLLRGGVGAASVDMAHG